MSVKINGVVKFQDIEGGFWSIIADSGEKLVPQLMPEQFKEEGAKVTCRIEYLEDEMGFQMFGTPVRIVSFRTIGS